MKRKITMRLETICGVDPVEALGEAMRKVADGYVSPPNEVLELNNTDIRLSLEVKPITHFDEGEKYLYANFCKNHDRLMVTIGYFSPHLHAFITPR